MHAEIASLYERFRVVPFPAVARCREADGVDLIAADYTTAGCVQTFVARGELDPWRLAVLGLCFGDLQRVVAGSDGEVREYFENLRELAEMVLKAIRDARSPTP
jgi:hypothetical protein